MRLYVPGGGNGRGRSCAKLNADHVPPAVLGSPAIHEKKQDGATSASRRWFRLWRLKELAAGNLKAETELWGAPSSSREHPSE